MVAGRGGLGFNPGAYNWDIVLVSKKMGIKDEHVQPMGGGGGCGILRQASRSKDQEVSLYWTHFTGVSVTEQTSFP